MSHLQEAVRTHFSSLTSLKQQAAQYRQEKEGKSCVLYTQFTTSVYSYKKITFLYDYLCSAAETRAEELRFKFQELTANSSLMRVSHILWPMKVKRERLIHRFYLLFDSRLNCIFWLSNCWLYFKIWLFVDRFIIIFTDKLIAYNL